MATPAEIARAAELIRRGGLVAFPTETVYGLGANALDAGAVRRIFEVKGRPSTSPLIVHVDSIGMAQRYVAAWPDAAQKLAERYWPGPLTLVLPKRAEVPDVVTAGLATVGVRVPAHQVALDLIAAAGVPIAAPSANRFTGLSPTRAGHVRESLGDAVDMVLDGGPCAVGIESTVVSLCGAEPIILRPGMISQGMVVAAQVPQGAHASPGQHKRHYQPKTPLYLGSAPETGRGIWLWLDTPRAGLRMPREPRGYAAVLYETLHRLDKQGWDWIAVERPPAAPEWQGILDRLMRAAA